MDKKLSILTIFMCWKHLKARGNTQHSLIRNRPTYKNRELQIIFFRSGTAQWQRRDAKREPDLFKNKPHFKAESFNNSGNNNSNNHQPQTWIQQSFIQAVQLFTIPPITIQFIGILDSSQYQLQFPHLLISELPMICHPLTVQ